MTPELQHSAMRAVIEVIACRFTRRLPLCFQHQLSSGRCHHGDHLLQQNSLADAPQSPLLKKVREIVISGICGLDEMEYALDQLAIPVSPALVSQVFGSSTSSGTADTRRLLRFFSWSRHRGSCEGTDGNGWAEAFSCALHAFADRADSIAMAVLIADHRKESLEMGLHTFTCAVDSLVKSGKEDDALCLFRMLERDEHQLEGGGGRRAGRVVALVHALCTRGHARKAEGIIRHHRDKLCAAEKAVVYMSLLHGWCVGRNARDARRVLEEMKAARIRPGLASYNTLLRCLCERNLKFNPSALVPEGFSVMAEMRTAGVPPTSVSFNILLSCLARSRRVKEAYKVLYSMRQGERGLSAPDWASYYLVVRLLYLTGRYIRGNRVIRQMLEDGVNLKVRFFHRLIGVLCGVEQVGFALELFEHMKGCRGQDCGPVYDMLITKLCKNGKFDAARRLWDEAAGRGVLLRCSSDLLDPLKTEVFKPTRNVEELEADIGYKLMKEKKKKKRTSLYRAKRVPREGKRVSSHT